MKTCLFLGSVEQWAKQGASVAMSEALAHHLERCERCASFAQSVQQARALGQQLPTWAMDPSRHEALKFRLMAEARGSRGVFSVGFARTRFSVRALALAAIVGSAAAAASATHHYVSHSDPASDVELPTASNAARPLPHLASRLESSQRAVALPTACNDLLQKTTTPLARPALEPGTEQRSVTAEPGSSADNDADSEFTRAWAALQSKRPAEAAKRFDTLLASSSLDSSRRADILYWSAQSHRQAGNTSKAMRRSSQLLQQYPNAPFAAAAALMLGEFAMTSDQFPLAKHYLTQASRSPHAVVRDRAKHALAELAKEPPR
jgi:tetratricopeptide (TPR) repeat protein